MMRRIPFLLAIAFCLAACEPEDLRILSTITSGGGSAPAQPAAPAQPETMTPPPPVMSSEFTEVASSRLKGDATKECIERSYALSQERGKTVYLKDVRKAVIGGAWICIFEEY